MSTESPRRWTNYSRTTLPDLLGAFRSRSEPLRESLRVAQSLLSMPVSCSSVRDVSAQLRPTTTYSIVPVSSVVSL